MTTPPSEAELDEALVQPMPAVIQGTATKLAIELVAKILFNHENRIRALEEQPSLDQGQYKAFLKSLL